MPAKVKANTKASSFEYVGNFAEPLFEPARVYSAVDSVYRALKPWNVLPQDVKYKGGITTPFDPIVSIELAKAQYVVNIGLGGFGFNGNAVDWGQAPVIIEIIQSTANALGDALHVVTGEHSLTLIMQVAVEGKPIKDLTLPLAPPFGYPGEKTDFFGFMLHTTGGGLFHVDKFTANPKDLYVRIVRKFKGSRSMTDMAKELHDDELWLANALGIEMD
jgi:hypothetical protein